MKLKDLIKESKVWERNFGEKLPTLDSVQKKYEKKLTEEIIEYDLSSSSADIYMQTHTTNPLLRKQTIINAIEKFSSEERPETRIYKYQ